MNDDIDIETGELAIQHGRVRQTINLVSAYVSNNPVSQADLHKLIADTHSALLALYTGVVPVPVKPEELYPAVPIKKSITPDYLICLEDGEKFKSLKRHLRTEYNLSPEAYRTKWGLPKDYPMVAPNYSATRSALAKASGLGTKGVSH
jgi:predicted transcriptional regulator